MQRLLIHCQSNLQLGEEIKNFIQSRLPYDVTLSSSRNATVEAITQRAVHMLLYETTKFVESDLQYIRDLRQQGYFYPTLIVADTAEIPGFVNVSEKLKCHLLLKPFEYKALRGITQKLMLSRNLPQQMHRRFHTQQKAVLETYFTGEVITSQMFNLSVGGAYFEFDGKPRVAVGDLVRLKVSLYDVSREHSVNARVVWTTRKGIQGGTGIGVRFIKGDDIYRQLMDKV